MINRNSSQFSFVLRNTVAGFGLLALVGCQTTATTNSWMGGAPEVAMLPELSILATIPVANIDTEAKRIAADGIAALDKHDYVKATETFNQALKLDISNSYLHFLNGMAYHLRAKRDEAQFYPLAIKGYEMALKFDGSNWLARYYLGLIYLDQRKFALAQMHLAQAALHKGDDPEVLYQLAAASYYAQDLRTAEATLSHLRSLDLPEDWRRKVMRVSAVSSAALGRAGRADMFRDKYKSLEPQLRNVQKVSARLASWQKTHDVAPAVELAQVEADGEEEANADEPFIDAEMAVVEVTIIRTEEDISTSTGVNLLSGLQIQFGDLSAGTPGFSFSQNKVRDLSAAQNDNVNTRAITKMISIPAITYSLNIANAQKGRNEVLARPTLVARSGQTSEFFSGVEVAAAATSGGNGDSVSIEKEIGVKLSVTPEFLPGGAILLNVEAERTFLTQPSRSVEFQFRLDTSKTTVNANVAMKFGQTLILSGLSERETERNKDGVPGLQDVPLLNLLFSRKTTRDFRKSVLILMTPRKAQYLNEPASDRERRVKKMTEEERVRDLLERKYSDWFEPVPTMGAIFKHLGTNRLYQEEFRTGDFPVHKWNGADAHGERLQELAELLYF